MYRQVYLGNKTESIQRLAIVKRHDCGCCIEEISIELIENQLTDIVGSYVIIGCSVVDDVRGGLDYCMRALTGIGARFGQDTLACR